MSDQDNIYHPKNIKGIFENVIAKQKLERVITNDEDKKKYETVDKFMETFANITSTIVNESLPNPEDSNEIKVKKEEIAGNMESNLILLKLSTLLGGSVPQQSKAD